MTSLISSEVTVAETVTEAPNIATAPSSLVSSEVAVEEAPAPPTAPEATAPERKALVALSSSRVDRSSISCNKEEEEGGRGEEVAPSLQFFFTFSLPHTS